MTTSPKPVEHRFRRRFDLIELVDGRPPFGATLLRKLGLEGLHCGSARKLYPGWLNSDRLHISDTSQRTTEPGRIARLDGALYYLEHDAADPFPFEAESFTWVFAEHFIEHLPVDAAAAWLREMHRLLRPGGFVRLSTPDLGRYVEGYLDPSGEFFAEHRRRLEALPYFEDTGVPERRAWMVNQIFQMWGHAWIYDFDEVRHVALQAGFGPESVRRCGYRSGRAPEVFGLDLPGRSDESLYVEIDRA